MHKKKIILLLVCLILIVFIISIYFLEKKIRESVKLKEKKVITEKAVPGVEIPSGGIVIPIEDLIKIKKSQLEEIKEYSESLSKRCNQFTDFDNLRPEIIEELKDIADLGTILKVTSYFVCQAIKNNSIERCSKLKDIDQKYDFKWEYPTYQMCIDEFILSQFISTNCSTEAIRLCNEHKVLPTAEKCEKFCLIVRYGQGKEADCQEIFPNPNTLFNMACLAVLNDDPAFCKPRYVDHVDLEKDCLDNYYYLKTLKTKDPGFLNKISKDTQRALAKLAIDKTMSCEEEFRNIVQNKCQEKKVSEKAIEQLEQEIQELEKRLP